MNTDVIEHQGQRNAVQMSGGALSANQIRDRVNLIQQVMKSVMKEGTHYDKIPGTTKTTLLKPGAEVLCMMFKIAPKYRIEDLSTPDDIRYRITCVGIHQDTGIELGEGLGECWSLEEKYKWRKSYKREYEAASEDRRRVKYGYNSQKREEFEILQIRTEAADVANTILKMGAKRAQAAMTINVTACSDMFTQDLEEMDPTLRESLTEGEGGKQRTVKQPQRKAAAAAPTATGPVNETQLKVINRTLDARGEQKMDALASLLSHFEVDSLAAIPAAKVNDAIDFARDWKPA